MESRVVVSQHALDEVVELLRKCNLPYQDISLENNLFLSYHDDSGRIIGSGGLEFYSRFALLRSVAVDENVRGNSIGKQIVNELLKKAKEKNAYEVYLLTDTARNFFINRGFMDVGRDNVPNDVKASSEFSSVCPVSASAMVYRIV
jgi:amino-acid N-acetyltransferase